VTGGDLRTHATSLGDLRDNFAVPEAQGSVAYADQMLLDHPALDVAALRTDAVIAVTRFVDQLSRRAQRPARVSSLTPSTSINDRTNSSSRWWRIVEMELSDLDAMELGGPALFEI
jgi:hypothetical protein